jgi:phytoene dehydrogenase-like protein
MVVHRSAYIPPFALRGDGWAVFSLWEYLWKLLSIGTKGALLTGPFSAVLDRYQVTNDSFVRKWFDYLAFALSGLDAAHTQAAAIAYMMIDLHTPNRVLDYPMGGMNALVQALVTGLEKHGGELRLNSRVETMMLEGNADNGKVTCRGVVLANGKRIRARRGVVCNAPLWNMARILSDSVDSSGNKETAVADCVAKIQQRASDMCMSGSFMHLHLGIPKDGLPADLECHHSVLDFSQDVTAEQNMVIISIPTVFDPSLAPEGYHIVHAYTAACDNFGPWEKFLEDGEIGKVGHSPNSGASKRYSSSSEYNVLKEEKANVLWKAIECVIPDVRERAQRDGSIVIVGTPLTHRRYNQRFRGTYGPAPSPGKDVWELAGSKTEIEGLLACGDTTFPGTFGTSWPDLSLFSPPTNKVPAAGIGLPGVAASGTIAANTLTDVKNQRALLNKMRQKGVLQ